MAEEIVEPTGPVVAEALCASGESAGVEPLAAEPPAAEPLVAGPLAVESLAAEPSAAASFPEQPAMPRFITLEGIDGCGKSTQAKLLAEDLERAGYDVLLLREPGGVTISEKIRELLLDPAHAAMSDTCELLLYEAARAQLVHEVVAPALAQGRIVVCDRFYDSTTAYQGYANGMDLGAVQRANALAVGACHPDLTLVFDIDPAKAAARAAARDRAQDRMEAKGLAYQERVAAGFRAIAAAASERVRLVDASRGIDAIHADVRALVLGRYPDILENADY